METVIPGLRRVGIDTPQTVRADSPAHGVGTGFSAGVDSFSVLAEHHFSPVPEPLRLTHLTFFNVGSHNSGETGRRRFRERFDLLAPVARDIGLPFIPVDSNLDDFFTFSSYQQTYGPRNIGTASLLQEGIGRYYFAGSFSFLHTGVRPSDDTAYSDRSRCPCCRPGDSVPSRTATSTRVEKTLIVADVPASHDSLNVCVTPAPDGRNCSRCEKCLRTELTLEIAGRLREYVSVFDLQVYGVSWVPFLDCWVTTADDVSAAEIRDQARVAGYRLPPLPMARLRHGVLQVRRRARSIGQRLRRRIGRPAKASGVS